MNRRGLCLDRPESHRSYIHCCCVELPRAEYRDRQDTVGFGIDLISIASDSNIDCQWNAVVRGNFQAGICKEDLPFAGIGGPLWIEEAES